jgi:putative transcriptional regulator
MSKFNIVPGSILLSSTKLDGSAWHRTLVMPLSVSNRVTGIIINQISTVSVDVLGFDLPYVYEDVPVYLGGPVKPRDIKLLHSTDWQTETSSVFYNDVAVTADTAAIDMFKIHQVPEYYRFIAGGVWWTRERLNKELDDKLWIPLSMNSTSVLAIPSTEQWDFVVSELSQKIVNKYFD